MTPNLFMMPWFPRDFIAATLGWRLLERAVYRELLDAQWEQGSLPSDEEQLQAIVRCTPAEWRAGWSPRVQGKFPVGADGLLRNARLEQHRAKAIDIAHKRSENGRRGAQAKVGRKQANA